MAKKHASQLKLILVMMPVMLFWILVIRWDALNFLHKPLENMAMNWRFQVRGELETPDVKLVYANVDSPTSDLWGERPYPRAYYGKLAEILFDYGHAKAVGFDFVFSRQIHSDMVPWNQVRAHDEELAETIRNYPNIVLGTFYSGSLMPLTMEERKIDRNVQAIDEKTRVLPYLRNAANVQPDASFPEMPTYPLVPGVGGGNLGLIDMDVEKNAGHVQRWVPMFSHSKGPYETINFLDGLTYALNLSKEELPDYVVEVDSGITVFDRDYNQLGLLPFETERTFYTMALELALMEHGLSDENVVIEEDALLVNDNDGNTVIEVPLTDGQVVETNWFSHWGNPDINTHTSVKLIFEHANNLENGSPELQADAVRFFEHFRDAVVLVGPTDPLLQDLAPSPFDSHPVPKVGVHGNLYKTLMTGLYITRLPQGSSLFFLIGLTLLVAFLGTYTGRYSSAAKAASFIILLAYIAAVFIAFSTYHLVIPLIAPVMCAVTTTTAGAVYQLFVEERQKGRIKGMFGTYISPELVDQMVESGNEPQLGGVEEHITAFFSDIQSFSSFSELLEPKQLVELMNEYLTSMTDILQEEGGTLDKYIGDAMVAMYNAPIPIEHHAYKACRAAALIQKRQAELRKKWADEGDKWPSIVPKMRTRIGLNTGSAIVGNMGSLTRFNYTMMGDTVNLAARCESGAKSVGVFTLVTEQTRNEAVASGSDLVFRYVDKWQVKGRSKPANMYELLGFRDELDANAIDAVRIYERGLSKYFERDFSGAIEEFEKAAKLELFQPDEELGIKLNPSLIMIQRCQHMQEFPPPEGWDGVYVMQTK